MNRVVSLSVLRLVLSLSLSLVLSGTGVGAAADTAVSTPKAKPLAGKVVRLGLTASDVTESGRWREFRELMDRAVAGGADALVLDINIAGGKAIAALPLAEEVARLKIRTLAYVNPAAVAGGALMALACDEIWMAPGSRIGAAPPAATMDEDVAAVVQETLLAESLALLKGGVRSLAKLKGHRPELAEAFVDRTLGFQAGGRTLAAPGQLLLLDGDDAAMEVDGKPLLARGSAGSVEEAAKKAGLTSEMATLSIALFEKPPQMADVAEVKAKAGAQGPAAAPAGKFGYTGKVVVIPVGEDDLVSRARFEFMSRTLERCTAEGAEAVIFDLDTPGGLAWDTTNLMMKDLQKLQPRSIAYVNPRAISAGAMIAVATDAIYMAPASSVGAATPVNSNGMEMGEAERAKINSAVMSMARTVAKEKGHDPRVIEAMIVRDRELIVNGEVLATKGELLTLDAEQAVMQVDGRPLFAKAIVRSLDELKRVEGLKGETVVAEPTGFEVVAIWVTKYAALLILIGIAGGYLELQAPGFGLPGFVSLAAFSLFFFGHYVAGSLVGQETAVAAGIFILGVTLLVLELLVFPGTLIFGIAGFLCVMVALVYTMSAWELPVPDATGGSSFSFTTYAAGLRNFALGVIGAAALVLLLARYIPQSRPFSRLVLAQSVGGGLLSTPLVTAAESVQVGETGIACSALRPYGTAEFDSRRLEVVVIGGYVQPGTDVRIVEVNKGRVVVEAIV